MRKSKKDLDLNIKREVSDAIRTTLHGMLTAYLLECEPFGLSEAELFAPRYLRDTLLSKYVDENTDPAHVRQQRAIVKWLTVEQRNERTNSRLTASETYFKGLGNSTDFLLHAAKLVRKVLGKLPDDLLDRGSFSGGASTSIRRGVGTLAKKFCGQPDVTPEAWPLLQMQVETTLWGLLNPSASQPRFVKGNILFTVPKTSVIDRVACKEPDLNVYGQKAVGDYIRKRLLRKAHINLNDQSINQELARIGSIDGSLATIDLSSASDSLTSALVMWLLPSDWYALLSALRSPKTFIDGKSHVNAMFSSMGNGFTFELESLIFWAIAKTIQVRTKTYGRISVYGDDIIVPAGCAGLLVQVLHWCGFKTNVDKTFIKGPFRESCGKHYYRGLDVTPFYLRRPIRDVSDLILFLNQYRQWLIITEMDTVDNGWSEKNRFVRFWYNLAAFVPKVLWGGTDLTSRTQLCSPGLQKCELLRTTRRWARLETELGIGLYLTRLSMMDRGRFPRDNDSVVLPWDAADHESQPTVLTAPRRDWTLRKVKIHHAVFGLAQPLFACEQ